MIFLNHPFIMLFNYCIWIQWSLIYPGCLYPETPLSGRFFLGTKKRNVILLHLAGNTCFRNRTVVWGTKPCFTMTIGPCYPECLDFKANWQYKHWVAYPCLIGNLSTFVNRKAQRAEYHRLSWLIEPLIGSINKHCIAMHVLNWLNWMICLQFSWVMPTAQVTCYFLCRFQCRDSRIQEHQLHSVGCGWPG